MLLSIVIPVYNSQQTIENLVEQLLGKELEDELEIVLVDDFSQDDSAHICEDLAKRFRGSVVFLQLARNFGQHNAIMAGLAHTTGERVVLMDDDFQHPPDAVHLLNDTMRSGEFDVVYSRNVQKKNRAWRNAGSWFNNLASTILLKKPYSLYLSSFKIMSRFAVDQVLRYRGPFPYIDGLLLQSVGKIGTVIVPHDERRAGNSSYTLSKLFSLWLNTFTNFSVVPLRLAFFLGLFGFVAGLALVGILVFERFYQSGLPIGYLAQMTTLVFFSSTILIVTGLVGEYVGRILIHVNGKPQFVVRRLVAEGEDQPAKVS